MTDLPRKEPKLGLCLSGGGFRASLFHIGALAALAEREMLHQVEVLSTVSGGSIIGAYYYLKVKRLLEGRVPGCPEVTPAAYLKIVEEIEQDFLAAVQKNIRLRLFMNPLSNLNMAGEDYSRSDRLAELLDEHFYNAAGGQPKILLKDIHIHPVGQKVETKTGSRAVVAKTYNMDAEYKIPILVINATCLNTGHPWHFTGAYVGEPKPRREFEAQVDTNFRLPRLSFDGIYHDDWELPPVEQRRLKDHQQSKLNCITLADAVAASSAVPGIFPPLGIHDLYPKDVKETVVELSDGGAFDNQGIDALYQHQCRYMIISDASGQLEDQCILGTKFYQVMQRSCDIMMNKIRSETLYRAHAGCEANAALTKWSIISAEVDQFPVLKENSLDGYAMIHLRQRFPNTANNPNFPGPVNEPDGTVYRLSGIRTDLDAFSDAEAYALMYDAHQLLHHHLESSVPLKLLSRSGWKASESWRFLIIRDVLRDPHRRDWLHARIKVGSKQFFRTFHLLPVRSWSLALPLLAAVLGGLWWIVCLVFYTPPQIACPTGCQPSCTAGFCVPADIIVFQGKISMHAVLLAMLAPLAAWLLTVGGIQEWLKKFSPVRGLRRIGGDAVVGVVLAILSILFAAGLWIYRCTFDKLFLWDGKLK